MYGPIANEGFSSMCVHHEQKGVPGDGTLGHPPEGIKASRYIRNTLVFANEQPAPGLVCTSELVKALKLNFSYVCQLQISVTCIWL